MFTELTDATYAQSVQNTMAGVLICYKKNCPHCKNMEKVLEKFSRTAPDVTLFQLDSEANPEALKELDAERAPTLFVIRQGKIVARKGGLMNPKELKVFYAAS